MTSSEQSKQTRKSELTRARILEAAEETLAENGFAGMRVDDVAAGAGVHRATLFYYYANKKEIRAAVLRERLVPLAGRMLTTIAASEPDETIIDRCLEVLMDYVGEYPQTAKILMREIVDAREGEPSTIREHIQPLVSGVEDVFARAFGGEMPEDVDPLSVMLLASGAIMFFVTAKPLLTPSDTVGTISPEDLSALSVQLKRLIRGLVGLPAAAQ